MPEKFINKVSFRSVDGTPITPKLVKRSLTETYSCVRCNRRFSTKDAHKSGGLIYIQADSDYSCAACARCLKRKRNETMRLFQQNLEQSVQDDLRREAARWN